STTAGRLLEPATTAGAAKAASCGATPMATRLCGTRTARAASPFRIWASSAATGPRRKFSPDTKPASPRQRLRFAPPSKGGIEGMEPSAQGGGSFLGDLQPLNRRPARDVGPVSVVVQDTGRTAEHRRLAARELADRGLAAKELPMPGP